MAEFVLKKNNYFEFDSCVFKISGTAIGTKFALLYARIFMDQHETKFLETQILKPLIWFQYIDDVCFIRTHGEEKIKKLMEDFNSLSHDIKFTYEFDKDTLFRSSNSKLMTSLYSKPTDCHQYLHYKSISPEHTKRSKSIVRLQGLRESVPKKVTLKNTLLNLNHGSLKEVILKKLLTLK